MDLGASCGATKECRSGRRAGLDQATPDRGELAATADLPGRAEASAHEKVAGSAPSPGGEGCEAGAASDDKTAPRDKVAAVTPGQDGRVTRVSGARVGGPQEAATLPLKAGRPGRPRDHYPRKRKVTLEEKALARALKSHQVLDFYDCLLPGGAVGGWTAISLCTSSLGHHLVQLCTAGMWGRRSSLDRRKPLPFDRRWGQAALLLLSLGMLFLFPPVEAGIPGGPAEEGLPVGLSAQERTLMAYDCSVPYNVSVVTTDEPPKCPEPDGPDLSDEREYTLLQAARYTRISVKMCQMTTSTVPFDCSSIGRAASTLIADEQLFNMPEPVPLETCKEWWETGHLNKHWKLKRNGTAQGIYDWNEGATTQNAVKSSLLSCQGAAYTTKRWRPGTKLSSIIYRKYARVQMFQQEALLAHDGTVTIYDSQLVLPCKAEKGECVLEEKGTYYWEMPPEEERCPLYKARAIKGRTLQREGHTLPVLVTTDGSMLKLEKRPPASHCNQLVTPTDFSQLFLAEGNATSHPPFTRPLHPHEASAYTYVNVQDAFVHDNLLAALVSQEDRVRARRCQERKAVKAYEYSRQAAEQAAVMDGETAHLGQGWFTTASGEVFYRYQCRPLVVQARTTEGCFSALPVRLLDRDVSRLAQVRGELELEVRRTPHYLEPRTHRLITTAAPQACAAPFTPLYKNVEGSWLAYQGETLTIAAEPANLYDADLEEKSWTASDKAFNFEEGGIYSAQTVRALEEFQQNPRAAFGTAATLAQQKQGAVRPGHPFPASGYFRDIPSESSVSLFMSFDWLWKWLARWGQIASVFIAVVLLGQMLMWLLDVLIRLFTPPRSPLCVHIAGAFVPAVEEYVHRQRDSPGWWNICFGGSGRREGRQDADSRTAWERNPPKAGMLVTKEDFEAHARLMREHYPVPQPSYDRAEDPDDPRPPKGFYLGRHLPARSAEGRSHYGSEPGLAAPPGWQVKKPVYPPLPKRDDTPTAPAGHQA